jgi:phosphoglycolate phosphatase
MFTKQLVESLQLQPIFDVVLGPDDVGAPKPDPAMLLEAIRRLGVSKNEAVYVGDMAIDVHTARRAGIPVWIVPGGATGLESPESAGPDKILTRFEDLLVLLPEPSHGPAD